MYFFIFSNCLPVRGYRRSIICDLQFNKYSIIPNDLYEILVRFNRKTIEEVINHYGENNRETIMSYFSFLEKHKYIYYDDDINLVKKFPDISLEWDSPSEITNCILDFNASSPHFLKVKEIADQLSKLNCKYLQIRFFFQFDVSKIDSLLSYFITTGIRSIEVVVEYSNQISDDVLKQLVSKHTLLTKVVIFNSSFNKLVNYGLNSILYIVDSINSELDCGKVHSKYFACNIEHFTESLRHNSCLNRKISVDSRGYIKNCPSMSISYGNILSTSLGDVLKKEEFKNLWKINKDQVLVCKDCEFRYICTDCRAYLEDSNNVYSKPLKCGYNPETCEWEEWSKNPLKKASIDTYGFINL